jgi:hypothetical protein
LIFEYNINQTESAIFMQLCDFNASDTFFQICIYHYNRCQLPCGSRNMLPRTSVLLYFCLVHWDHWFPSLLSARNNCFRVVYWQPGGASLAEVIVPKKLCYSGPYLHLPTSLLNFVYMPLRAYMLTSSDNILYLFVSWLWSYN